MSAVPVTSGVEVAWKLDNTWSTGFQASAKVTNRTAAPLDPWAVDLSMGHQITSFWDANRAAIPGGYRITGPNWSAAGTKSETPRSRRRNAPWLAQPAR